MEVYYDSEMDCYCLVYEGEVVVLGSDNLKDAEVEAFDIINGYGI